jgi:ATP-dependent RNA helicase RhlE
VRDLGFSSPTPIQTDAIPPAMTGRDALGCAMTGSGKTAAFLLPILHRLVPKPRGATRALVLAPTRELAAQINEQLRALSAHTRVRGAAVFGGVAHGPQERAFQMGVDIIVATPGRLLDHLQVGPRRLSAVEILVLDEADRMLDMGFLPDIRRVLRHLPAERQTLLFSATLPPPIQELARELLRDPVKINVHRPAAPASGVSQALYPVAQELKTRLLLELLRRGEIGNALVFTRTKHRANRVAEFLSRHGVACDRIHGNRTQAQRTKALARFKAGQDQVLVATDIAARGIDVEALSHVINFDVPTAPEDYIHRVGRTARASATGDALTFAAPAEQGEVAAIERAIGKRLPRHILDGFDYQERPNEKLEIPLGQRIAEIRARRTDERARSRAKAEPRTERGRPTQGRGGAPAASAPPRPGRVQPRAAGGPGRAPSAQPMPRHEAPRPAPGGAGRRGRQAPGRSGRPTNAGLRGGR